MFWNYSKYLTSLPAVQSGQRCKINYLHQLFKDSMPFLWRCLGFFLPRTTLKNAVIYTMLNPGLHHSLKKGVRFQRKQKYIWRILGDFFNKTISLKRVWDFWGAICPLEPMMAYFIWNLVKAILLRVILVWFQFWWVEQSTWWNIW